MKLTLTNDDGRVIATWEAGAECAVNVTPSEEVLAAVYLALGPDEPACKALKRKLNEIGYL